MSRVTWLAVIVVLAFGAYSARPPVASNPTVTDPTIIAPNAAGCIVSVGRGQTGSLNVIGEAEISVGGESITTGDGSLSVDEVTPSGEGSALIDFVGPGGAAVVESDGLIDLAANCSAVSTAPLVISGISTGNGRQVSLVLANPYALDAVIDITSSSEVGSDTASELDSMVVPAGAIAVRDVSRILPLRRHLSLTLSVRSGSVHGVVYETGPDDGRASEAVAGADEWWAIFPPIEGLTRHLTIVPATVGAIPFQIDLYTTEGLVEAAIDNSVPAGAQFDVMADELGTAQAVRVISAGPVVAAISLEGDDTMAGGPAAGSPASSWVLPGAGVLPGTTTVWVFNPGDEDVSVSLIEFGSDGGGTSIVVPAGALLGIPMASTQIGYTLVAQSPVVTVWTSMGAGLAYAAGIAIDG